MYLDNLNLVGNYPPARAYAQSKLANLLFTSELQRRLTAVGSQVRAQAAHPGWAATSLQPHTSNPFANLALRVGNVVVAQSAESGARSALYAATQDLPGDSFAGPGGIGGMRGAPKLVGRHPAARDPQTAARLWALSEQLTATAFPLGAAAGESAPADCHRHRHRQRREGRDRRIGDSRAVCPSIPPVAARTP
jgi:NAD(P)-dependent dehydrogenase (short-subunit alcohol dehydrogenase family)